MTALRPGERDPFFAWLVSSIVSGVGLQALLDEGAATTLLAKVGARSRSRHSATRSSVSNRVTRVDFAAIVSRGSFRASIPDAMVPRSALR